MTVEVPPLVILGTVAIVVTADLIYRLMRPGR